MYSPITDMLVTVKDYSNLGEDAIPTKHNVLLKDHAGVPFKYDKVKMLRMNQSMGVHGI